MHVKDHFRAAARRPTSLSARVEFDGLGHDLAAELVNLGIGGACVVLPAGLERGSLVRLRIEAPQLWEPLVLGTRVAWTREESAGVRRYGVQFEPATASTLMVLTELVGYNGYL